MMDDGEECLYLHNNLFHTSTTCTSEDTDNDEDDELDKNNEEHDEEQLQPPSSKLTSLKEAIQCLSQQQQQTSLFDNIPSIQTIIINHMGTMAQCRIYAKDIQQLGGIDVLMTILYSLVIRIQEQQQQQQENNVLLVDDDVYQLATIVLGTLRDLACGNGLNRETIGRYPCQTPSSSTDVTVGTDLLSFFIRRHNHQRWEDIASQELKCMTNALGVIRNITHKCPDSSPHGTAANCQALHENGMTRILIDRILLVEQQQQQQYFRIDDEEETQQQQQAATTTSDGRHVPPPSLLPDASKPWREACYRLVGSLINIAEQCDEAAEEFVRDEALISTLVETWGSTKKLDQKKIRAIPVLWEKLQLKLNNNNNNNKQSKPQPLICCDRCGELFTSRTKLFQHLRSTSVRDDGKPGCAPKFCEEDNKVWVCFSVSYYSCEDPQECLLCALQDCMKKNGHSADENEDIAVSLIWGVPPELTSSAVVNVVTAQLPRGFVDNVLIGSIPVLLNQAFIINPAKKEHFFKVHTAGIVDTPCAPERREFEKYSVFIPWAFLQTQERTNNKNDGVKCLATVQHQKKIGEDENDDVDPNQVKKWRRPLQDTPAFEYVDDAVARRLKHASRLMKDGGKKSKECHLSVADNNSSNPAEEDTMKIRVRTSSMDDPWHRLCRISISMRQPKPGYVGRLAGLLLAYARFEMEDDAFIDALVQTVFTPKAFAQTVQKNETVFPSNLVLLVEPSVTRYETKMKLPLCRDSLNASDELKRSISKAEDLILQQMFQTESQELPLKMWMSNCNLHNET